MAPVNLLLVGKGRQSHCKHQSEIQTGTRRSSTCRDAVTAVRQLNGHWEHSAS